MPFCHLYSDEQGFGNACGYMGKGTAGTGRGKNLRTLPEPLPSVRVMGYPHSSGRVLKSEYTNNLMADKFDNCFPSQPPPSTVGTGDHSLPLRHHCHQQLVLQMAQLGANEPMSRAVILASQADKSATSSELLEPCLK
jgi:hypothetical protein